MSLAAIGSSVPMLPQAGHRVRQEPDSAEGSSA